MKIRGRFTSLRLLSQNGTAFRPWKSKVVPRPHWIRAAPTSGTPRPLEASPEGIPNEIEQPHLTRNNSCGVQHLNLLAWRQSHIPRRHYPCPVVDLRNGLPRNLS